MKYIYIFAIVIFSFGIFNISHAEEVYLEQLISSTSTISVSGTHNQYIQFSDTEERTLNSLKVFVKVHDWNDSNSSMSFVVYGCNTTWNTSTGNCTGGYSPVIMSATPYQDSTGKPLPLAYRDQYILYSISDDGLGGKTLTSTTTGTMLLRVDCAGAIIDCSIRGSINADSFLNGEYQNGSDVDVKDIFFQLGSDLSSATNTIQIVDPTDGEVTENFLNWGAWYNLDNTFPLNNYLIGVTWGTSTQTFSDGRLACCDTNVQTPFAYQVASPSSLELQYQLRHFGEQEIGDYYAVAFVRQKVGDEWNVVATSTMVQYSQTTAGIPVADVPMDFFEDFDVFTDFIFSNCKSYNETVWYTHLTVKGMKCALFEPHASSTEAFINSFNGLKNIFPFNVFFSFNDFTNRVFSDYVGSTTPGVTVEFPKVGSVQLLTDTLLEDNLGSSVTNQIFEIQRNIIWVVTGIMILAFIF